MTHASEPLDGSAPPPVERRLLQHWDFILFMLSRGGTVMAAQIVTVAVGWDIYVRTGSVMSVGLVGLFKFAPVLCLFLFAGIAADRYDRRLIIGSSNVIHAAATIGIGAFLWSDATAIWPVFPLLALQGSAQAFLTPAIQSTLPNIVPRALFPKAVAAASVVTKLSQLLGPAAGGFMIAFISEATYFIAAALSVVAAGAAYAITAQLKVTTREPFGLDLILGGFRHIWESKIVLGAISIDLVAVLFGGIMGLLPVFAVDILKVGPEYLGVMRATPAVGAVSVALVLARTRLPGSVGTTFFSSLALFGISILVFTLSETLWLSLGALLVYGAADMVSVYVRQTLVQLGTPDALRGRVSAVNSVSLNASNELGDFRAGGMAAIFGTVPAVALGAAMTLAATALWWRIFPQLRSLDRI